MKNFLSRFERVIVILLLTMSFSYIHGQKAIDREITMSFEEKNFVSILYEIEQKEKIKFYFDPLNIPYFEYSKAYQNKPLWSVLKDLLNGALISIAAIDSNSVGLIPSDKLNKQYINDLIAKWNNGTYKYPFENEFFSTLIFQNISTSDQNKDVGLTLLCLDENNDPIIGMEVTNQEKTIATVTNVNGEAIIILPSGKSLLTTKYSSYKDGSISLNIFRDTTIKIIFPEKTLLLQEVQIKTSKLAQASLEKQAGVQSIDMRRVTSIVQASGDADIIKSLEILPGVKNIAEVSSGFNVRGGNIDENMVILNDAVLFNPTHALGLTSAFNSDAVQSVTLSKAYIDPQYGGWNSSVLDIKTKYGDQDKWKGTATIGSAIGKVTAYGPINSFLSVMGSARINYANWMLRRTISKEISNSSVSFYDVNIASKCKINKSLILTLDHFSSGDNFDYNKEFGFEWKNQSYSASLVKIWNQKFNSKLHFSISKYNQSVQNNISPLLNTVSSGISTNKMFLHNNYIINSKFTLKGGVNIQSFSLAPEITLPIGNNSTIKPTTIRRSSNINIGPYLALAYNLSKKWNTEFGIRQTINYLSGDRQEFVYSNETLPLKHQIIDTLITNKIQKSSQFFEPRININYYITKQWAIKSSYTQTSQNINLIVNANTTLPSDIWILSNKYLKPRQSTQYSFGSQLSHDQGKFTVSGDVYFKKYKNAIITRDFSKLTQNDHIETELLKAEAISYGAELAFEFNVTKWNGTFAYTYAKALQKNIQTELVLRNNQYFDADNDIPHQINSVINFKPNEIMTFNTNFIYRSGRPFSVPQGTIKIDDFLVPFYTERNANRLPDYIRIDVGVTLDFRKVRNSGLRHSFSLGIYNLMGRNNALNIFFRRSDKGNINGYKLSLLGAAIPSLSWNMIL